MARPERICPPYAAEKPFLYLCFCDADAKRVFPLLKRLYTRGCRVWYPVGAASTVAASNARTARMRQAKLVVLYQTARARTDSDMKAAMLVCQAQGIPIISIDTDNAESMLSMGLNTTAKHIKARSQNAIEDALLHTEGFTQDLIGTPKTVPNGGLWKAAIAVFAAALAFGAVAVLYQKLRPKPEPTVLPQDTVTVEDDALREQLRAAVGGGPLTEQSLSGITTLRLVPLPEDCSGLAALPNLNCIEIDQSDAERALPLLDRYEIVLIGGGA